ncbi:glycosyltransferase [Nonomuraea typhae]|uniref:glycosyltransferase n=1 Tax=Nonomuraea typhae TaxID=2603600 RepID=UPI0012FB95A9|nr:glycosyltransferase [Nonomuraea typhae]
MNIALVATPTGSRRDSMLAIARELGHRHRVTIYARRTNAEDKPRTRLASGVTLETIDAGPARELADVDVVSYLPELSRYLMRTWSAEAPDVIHAHSWTSGLAAVAGSEGLGVPVTQTLRPSGPARLKLEQALGRRADAVIAGSGDEESKLIRLGVPRRSIAIIPAGVDVDRFRRHGAVAARGAGQRILYVGDLTPDKGAHTAVRALGALPEVELVVAGGPDPADLATDRDARRLAGLAAGLGVGDRVRLLGRVPRAQMPRLMRSADVVITLPREAPGGIVALEAMACGVPVIASAVGAHLDSVVDGVTGLLVPPDRPARTARLARRLLTDVTLRTALGYAGADRVRSRYSWERIGQELVRVYEDALVRS